MPIEYGQRGAAAISTPVSEANGGTGRTNGAAQKPARIVKTANTSRTSTTTTANDNELVGISLGVGTYYIEAALFYTAGSTAPGVVSSVSFTGTMTTWQVTECLGNLSAGNADLRYANDTTTPSSATWSRQNPPGSSADWIYNWRGFFTVSVAGTFAIAWAQQTSSATPSTLKANSWVRWVQE